MPLLAVNRRLSFPISSCSSLNKPRSSSVIALYNWCRFSDHWEDIHDDLDPDLVTELDLDPGCDLKDDSVSVDELLPTPSRCVDRCASNVDSQTQKTSVYFMQSNDEIPYMLPVILWCWHWTLKLALQLER